MLGGEQGKGCNGDQGGHGGSPFREWLLAAAVWFHPRFDLIILLSAPAEVVVERLASRTSNCFGKSPGELERVLDDLRAVEPLLRQTADHEIRTTKPLSHVVTEVLRLASA